MTDRNTPDATTDRQRTGAPHPFTPTDDAEASDDAGQRDTPFVPAGDRDDEGGLSVSITHSDVNTLGVALAAVGAGLVLLSETAPHASATHVLTAGTGVLVAVLGALLWSLQPPATR